MGFQEYKTCQFASRNNTTTEQFLLLQEELEIAAPNITRLGLLFETNIDVASVREQPTYVSFPHKLMQEFSAALFITDSLNEAENMTVRVYHYKCSKVIFIQK